MKSLIKPYIAFTEYLPSVKSTMMIFQCKKKHAVSSRRGRTVGSSKKSSLRKKIVTKSSELTEIEAQLSNQTHELKTLDTRFEQFVSWADEFENAPVPRQRMIVNLLLDGVYVFRGYKILVTMKSTYKQFLSDWIDKAS